MEILDTNGELMRQRLKPRSDSFKNDRGGSSQFLDLYCSICDAYLGTYQKDGAGNLFRLYVDRLTTPYHKYTEAFNAVEEMPKLICPNPNCKQELGVPMLYPREHRLAYRIVASIHKKKNHSGKYPPDSFKKEDLF